jgi:hypothetical protein
MVPHTVSEALMPGCDERARTTLVAIQADLDGDKLSGGQTGQVVRQVVRACAGPQGLTQPQIRDLAIEQGAGKSQTYVAMKALISGSELINVGTEKTPRYILSPNSARNKS